VSSGDPQMTAMRMEEGGGLANRQGTGHLSGCWSELLLSFAATRVMVGGIHVSGLLVPQTLYGC
jgi:hypothetical protein